MRSRSQTPALKVACRGCDDRPMQKPWGHLTSGPGVLHGQDSQENRPRVAGFRITGGWGSTWSLRKQQPNCAAQPSPSLLELSHPEVFTIGF